MPTMGCGEKMYGHRQCGYMFGGVMQFCDACRKRYTKLYPQGWVGYPGDTCRHGTYVGGIGADHMCGRCEMGE